MVSNDEIVERIELIYPLNEDDDQEEKRNNTNLSLFLNLPCELFGFRRFLFFFLFSNPYFLLVSLVFSVPTFFAQKSEPLYHLQITVTLIH